MDESQEMRQLKQAFLSTPALSSAFAFTKKRNTATGVTSAPLKITNKTNFNVLSSEDLWVPQTTKN